MKKILLAIAAIIITAGAYAQTDSTDRKWSQSDNKQYSDAENKNHPDGFMYKDGKMLMVKSEKTTRVENDVTLTNGTVIMSNGNYIKKGGTKMMLKEGEYVDMSGNVVQRSDSKNINAKERQDEHKDMYLIRDKNKNKQK